MKKLTIGFSKARSKYAILSALIRLIENIPFSHVYIKFHSESLERDIIYQASQTMVNFMSPKIFESHSLIVEEFEFEVPDAVYKNILQYAIDNAGKPYGAKALIGLGLIKLCRLFGKQIKNPFKDGSSSYICLELIGSLLFISGLIYDETDLESIGLKEFYGLIKAL